MRKSDVGPTGKFPVLPVIPAMNGHSARVCVRISSFACSTAGRSRSFRDKLTKTIRLTVAIIPISTVSCDACLRVSYADLWLQLVGEAVVTTDLENRRREVAGVLVLSRVKKSVYIGQVCQKKSEAADSEFGGAAGTENPAGKHGSDRDGHSYG